MSFSISWCLDLGRFLRSPGPADAALPAVIFDFFFDFRSFFQVYPLASRYDPNIFQDMAFTSYIGAGRECKREEKKNFFCSEIIPSDDCIVKFFFIFRMSPCAPRAFFAKIKDFYVFERFLARKASFQSGARRSFD